MEGNYAGVPTTRLPFYVLSPRMTRRYAQGDENTPALGTSGSGGKGLTGKSQIFPGENFGRFPNLLLLAKGEGTWLSVALPGCNCLHWCKARVQGQEWWPFTSRLRRMQGRGESRPQSRSRLVTLHRGANIYCRRSSLQCYMSPSEPSH